MFKSLFKRVFDVNHSDSDVINDINNSAFNWKEFETLINDDDQYINLSVIKKRPVI